VDLRARAWNKLTAEQVRIAAQHRFKNQLKLNAAIQRSDETRILSILLFHLLRRANSAAKIQKLTAAAQRWQPASDRRFAYI
jgi:hypothetical protein